MNKYNFKLTTNTPITNIDKQNRKYIACYSDWIFFLNLPKLEYILSLMKYLLEFISYTNSTNNKNLTNWLKTKNLLYYEFLEEISIFKIKSEFKSIKSTAPKKLPYSAKDNQHIKQFIKFFIKENLKNICLYNYLRTNNSLFNQYISKVIKFYMDNPNELNKINFDKFIGYCLKTEHEKLKHKYKTIDDLDVEISLSANQENILRIEKFVNDELKIEQICITENKSFNIEIYASTIDIKMIKEYIQIS